LPPFAVPPGAAATSAIPESGYAAAIGGSVTTVTGCCERLAGRSRRGFTPLSVAKACTYLRQFTLEKAKVHRIVLSNCAVDAATLYPKLQEAIRVDFRTDENRGMAHPFDWSERVAGSCPAQSRGVLDFAHRRVYEAGQTCVLWSVRGDALGASCKNTGLTA